MDNLKEWIGTALLVLFVLGVGFYTLKYDSSNNAYNQVCDITRGQAIDQMQHSPILGEACKQKYAEYMNKVPCKNISQSVDFRILCKGVNISDNETINTLLESN